MKMNKTYMIKETLNCYHTVILDEEIDIEDIVSKANENKDKYDTGYEAIEAELEYYKQKYGFDYQVKANDCGTDIIEMETMQEID